jgi:hypothetical protein
LEVSCPAEEGTAAGSTRDADMGNPWEVVEAGAAIFEGCKDKVCTPFLHVKAVFIHNEVANDDGNNLISIHEHHRLVLFDDMLKLGWIEDMIEIGICVALVVDLSLAKPELGKFLIGVGLLEDLVLGWRVDRLRGQLLQLYDLDAKGVTLILETLALKEPTLSGTCMASLQGFPNHQCISSKARLKIGGNCMLRGDSAFAKHGLHDIESIFLGAGSGKLVGDSGSGSSDMLIHFFRGSVVVQHSEKLGWEPR